MSDFLGREFEPTLGEESRNDIINQLKEEKKHHLELLYEAFHVIERGVKNDQFSDGLATTIAIQTVERINDVIQYRPKGWLD